MIYRGVIGGAVAGIFLAGCVPARCAAAAEETHLLWEEWPGTAWADGFDDCRGEENASA